MSARNSSEPAVLEGDDPSSPDAVFQFAVAVYGGVVLGGVAATTGALIDAWPVALTATYGAGFAVGFAGGAVLAGADRRLPVRLARTVARRLALVAPAVPLLAAWFVPIETGADAVALLSAIAVFAAGFGLSQVAGNRYVDAVAPGDPAETWRWEPAGSVVLDSLLVVLYAFLAVGNAVSGNWLETLLWLCIAALWIGSCLLEGRWEFGPGRSRCEIQLYDTGLVKRRPYTRTFVPWHEIDHTRLRGDELVLDRGLRDVRFDREELEDLDGLLEAVDRRLAAIDS